MTFIYVFLGVPLHLAFALLVAMLMNQKVRALGFFRGIYYLPSLLGGSVAVAVMWRQLFGDGGVVNQFIGLFGIDAPNWIVESAIRALHADPAARLAVRIGDGHLPRRAEAGAAGALRRRGDRRRRPLEQFWHITLPMITPVIFFNLVMGSSIPSRPSPPPTSSAAAPAARRTRPSSTRCTCTSRASPASTWAMRRPWPGYFCS